MATIAAAVVKLIFVVEDQDCTFYKTAELSQRRTRDAPNIWVH